MAKEILIDFTNVYKKRKKEERNGIARCIRVN